MARNPKWMPPLEIAEVARRRQKTDGLMGGTGIPNSLFAEEGVTWPLALSRSWMTSQKSSDCLLPNARSAGIIHTKVYCEGSNLGN